jgi:phage shock protein PspC (stress-responsive transcriptional regulator)
MTEQAMKRCPYCAEEIRAAAVKCRYCGSALDGAKAFALQWYRLREGKRIAGVCAGLADYYGVPVAALRLAAVVLALLGAGWGVVLYVVLWIVMPYRDRAPEWSVPSRAADEHIY